MFEIEHWQTSEFQLWEIAPRTYLLAYTLFGQGSRLTRRLTVWQGRRGPGLEVLYHQGTLVQDHP